MKKNILIILLFLSTITLGFKVINSNHTSIEESQVSTSDLAQDEVRVVIKDYPKEASEISQSVLKARNYYEKAFSLFLMTLGVRLSLDQKEELQELIENPNNYLAKADSPTQGDRSDLKVEQVGNELDFTPAAVFADIIKKKELVFDHVSDQTLIKALQEKVLRDPDLFYARSKYIKNLEPLKKIIGEYRGVLFRIAGKKKGRVDDILLRMDFRMKDENVEGDFRLVLSHDGGKYSDSRGNGSNGNVRIKGEDFVIDSGPGTFFHFVGKSFEQANFYVKGELVGFARFERQ